jgi:microcystin-dependent protein
MSDPYIGEIRMFGGNFAPADWAFCHGQVLAITEYESLFTLIGTTYGGDGQSTFALPNLQSRIPLHAGDGPGLSTRVLGAQGGAESVTLTAAQLPVHSHRAGGSSAAATSASPAGAVTASGPNGPYLAGGSSPVAMRAGVVGIAGGGQPHGNLPPYLAISFIISLYGIYPTQG